MQTTGTERPGRHTDSAERARRRATQTKHTRMEVLLPHEGRPPAATLPAAGTLPAQMAAMRPLLLSCSFRISFTAAD